MQLDCGLAAVGHVLRFDSHDTELTHALVSGLWKRSETQTQETCMASHKVCFQSGEVLMSPSVCSFQYEVSTKAYRDFGDHILLSGTL